MYANYYENKQILTFLSFFQLNKKCVHAEIATHAFCIHVTVTVTAINAVLDYQLVRVFRA